MKKMKKKTNGTKCTITSVSENSVNASERENAPFLILTFSKQSRGVKSGEGAQKEGKKSGCNYKIIFVRTSNILVNIFGKKSVQINNFVNDENRTRLNISGRETENNNFQFMRK